MVKINDKGFNVILFSEKLFIKYCVDCNFIFYKNTCMLSMYHKQKYGKGD